MKVRNKNENVRYVNHIDSAVDQVQQAIDSISYSSYPDLNKRTIAKLQEALDLLDRARATPIFKPN